MATKLTVNGEAKTNISELLILCDSCLKVRQRRRFLIVMNSYLHGSTHTDFTCVLYCKACGNRQEFDTRYDCIDQDKNRAFYKS